MHIRELFHKPKLYVMTSLEKKVGYISDDLSKLLQRVGGSQASFYRACKEQVVYRGFHCRIKHVDAYAPRWNELVHLVGSM